MGGLAFSVAPGALAALGGAGRDTTDRDVEKLSLSGDLGQMGTMAARLRRAGFDVRNSDVYPVIQGEDEIKRALQYLWDNRVDGWWNQERAFIKYGIATHDEWLTRLREQV